MVIKCPLCRAQYRIDPSASKADVARIKCPGCEHAYKVSLAEEKMSRGEKVTPLLPVVMVVDDARLFREMVKDILKVLPVELILVADGNEAWQQISNLEPPLVLLDLNIPGKNGRELLQSLQVSPLCGHVKVLAMSAVERSEEVASEVCQLGAIDFISKSFKPIELQNHVRNILGL